MRIEPERLRRLLLLSVLVAAGLLSATQIAAEFYVGQFKPDFTVFWIAARMAPANLYDFAAVTAAQTPYVGAGTLRPWIYPPSFLPWLEPFGLLPLWVAYAAWAAATAAAFVVALRAATGTWKVPLVALACPAVTFCLLSGQSSLLVGALTLAGVLTLPTRPLVAGLLFAVAATIKPQVVMLVPLALISAAQWRALAACVASGAVIGGASFVANPALWTDWLRATQDFLPVVESLNITHRSLSAGGIADLFHLTGATAWAVTIVAGGLGVALVVVAWRSQADPILRSAALVAGCLLVSPYAMGYDASLLSALGLALLMDPRRPRSHWVAGTVLVTATGAVLVTLGAFTMLAAVLSREGKAQRVSLAQVGRDA